MKPWYKSKMVWLNLASFLTTFLGAVAQVLPSLQGLMTMQHYLVLNGFVACANIILRTYFTSTAIE